MPSSATSPVAWPYALLADAVLVLHAGIVLFVVGGLLLVVLGNWRGWPWVNRPWFRLAHLAAITVVVAESWLGLTCPLTTLEWWLRARAGVAPYESSFIAYWLQTLLFYEAPGWVFALAYTVFGVLVAAAWWRFPPTWAGSRRKGGGA
ncbi:MAG: DUF2784 domain-containing protein [Rubrivivax sp.]|jgi:hypothetical protein|nr:DUF2784 domain-containing protein [Betaproteobacteria bacterium]MBP6319196.1 DUF2784 domain-containing protein [Rubrivivax sp.]MBK7276962.1 DUF2784 domain-containing protein [Betaproteobacteria bacterium]MBK7515695.1 DUF2784 domain-containing protein [Betaproteobacteria bacterium]MBK8106550.1 DUF2784 domain-containing protein [Betaproteobacteria bacterium]